MTDHLSGPRMYVLQTHGSRTEPAAQGRGASRDRRRVRGASRFVSRRIEPRTAAGAPQGGQTVRIAAEGGDASQQRSETASTRHDEQSRTCSARRRFAAHDRSGRSGLPVPHGYEAKDSRGARVAAVVGGRSVPRCRPRLILGVAAQQLVLPCDARVLVETQSSWPVAAHVPVLATCARERRVHGAGKAR